MNVYSSVVARGLVVLPISSSPPELKLHLVLHQLKSDFHSLVNLLLSLRVTRDLICIQNLNVPVLFTQLRRLKVKQVTLMMQELN